LIEFLEFGIDGGDRGDDCIEFMSVCDVDFVHKRHDRRIPRQRRRQLSIVNLRVSSSQKDWYHLKNQLFDSENRVVELTTLEFRSVDFARHVFERDGYVRFLE
jgi:hypothetical protein